MNDLQQQVLDLFTQVAAIKNSDELLFLQSIGGTNGGTKTPVKITLELLRKYLTITTGSGGSAISPEAADEIGAMIQQWANDINVTISNAIGTDSKADTVRGRIKVLENNIGTNDTNETAFERIAALEDAMEAGGGSASEEQMAEIRRMINQVSAAVQAEENRATGAETSITNQIGADTDSGTVKGRIKTLETKVGSTAVSQQISTAVDSLSDRMDSYDELVEVSLAGGNMGVINNTDNIKYGQSKVPTGNAIAGLARYGVANDWIYAVTDNGGKVLLGIRDNGKVFANGLSTTNIVVAKDGSGDYDNLMEAIIKTYQKKNVVIHIMPGEYDVISEIESLYPGYFENYNRENNVIYNVPNKYDYGPRLGSGITLIGCQGNHITCHYSGKNNNIRVYFSPFNNDGDGGFKMIGLNIECSMVRYCVHDERGIDNQPYEVLYDSCQMTIDNDQGQSSPWKNICCIGGGLGLKGRIKVLNCIFDTPKDVYSQIVYFHDSSGDFSAYRQIYGEEGYPDVDPENYVVCNGNYLKGNSGFSFRWHSKTGNSKTRFICCNNSVGADTAIYKADSQDREESDIEVLEWNNINRNK